MLTVFNFTDKSQMCEEAYKKEFKHCNNEEWKQRKTNNLVKNSDVVEYRLN